MSVQAHRNALQAQARPSLPSTVPRYHGVGISLNRLRFLGKMNPMSIVVRQVALSDIETVLPLFDSYRQFYGAKAI